MVGFSCSSIYLVSFTIYSQLRTSTSSPNDTGTVPTKRRPTDNNPKKWIEIVQITVTAHGIGVEMKPYIQTSFHKTQGKKA